MPDFVYFDANWAIIEHDNILRLSGGLSGVPKRDQLAGMLDFIKDDGYYPEFEDKLTHLVFSLAKNHYFADGNKRSSIAVSAYFLQVNGLGGLVPRFIVDMEHVVLCVADDIISKEELRGVLVDHLKYGEMSEVNKLLVVDAVLEYERRERERAAGNQAA